MTNYSLTQIRTRASRIMFVLLALIITLCGISIQSSGKARSAQLKKEPADILAEQIYRDRLREFLNQAGYQDSGINMTSVTVPPDAASENGTIALREYKVSIYHKKINKLSESDASDLLSRLVMIEVPMEGCKVSHNFIN